MSRKIGAISLVVRNYDEAIEWFTRCLRFELIEDSDRGGGKRWVLVAPTRGEGSALLLAQAASAEQTAHIGDQTGGRVFLFLHTDDFEGDYRHMQMQGVKFIETPRHEDYGSVVVFKDICGNRWDLLQLRKP